MLSSLPRWPIILIYSYRALPAGKTWLLEATVRFYPQNKLNPDLRLGYTISDCRGLDDLDALPKKLFLFFLF